MMRNKIDVRERRLKTIFDALDCSNIKKAIYEADKVLKKDQTCHTAKALKALAFLRSSRPLEAAAIIDQLYEDVPTEESTFHALTFYFRESGQVDQIVNLLEKACAKCPDREDLLTHLFFANVRRQDYKAQQVSARQLHKLFPTRGQFYSWLVMSTVMQAEENPALGLKMYLPLAEKMLGKQMEDGKMESDCDVDLYLLVLEKLSKYSEAQAVILSGIYEKLPKMDQRIDGNIVMLDYYEKTKSWLDLCDLAERILVENPDDWMSWEKYLLSIFLVNESKDNGHEISVKSTLELVSTSLSNHPHVRGPYLAQFRLTEMSLGPCRDLCPPVEQQLASFFDKFGHKQVAAYDLYKFMPKILPNLVDQQKFVQSLLSNSSDSPFESLSKMHRRLCTEQLARMTGLHGQAEDRLSVVDRLCQYYWDSLHFGKDLKSSEIQPADGFLCLAVAQLHDIWRDELSSNREQEAAQSPLIRAAVLLESAIRRSPSNHHFKLRLVKIYGLMGCLAGLMRAYESLDVKQLMWDSLGFMLTDHSTRLGQYYPAINQLNHMVKLQYSSSRDIEDCLITAYKHSAYRKAVEFISFRRRLQISWQFEFARIDQRFINIFLTPNSFEHLLEEIIEYKIDINQNFDPSELVDGRDFEVSKDFDMADIHFTEDLQKKSFANELEWLNLRHTSVRVLMVLCKLAMQSGQELDQQFTHPNGSYEVDDRDSEMANLASSLRQRITDMRSNLPQEDYTLNSGFGLISPNMCITSLVVHNCFGDVLLASLDIMTHIRKSISNNKVEDTVNEMSIMTSLVTPLETALANFSPPTCQSLDQMPLFLTKSGVIMETVALASLCVCCAEAALKPIRYHREQSGKRRTKKKKKPQQKNNGVGETVSADNHPLSSSLAAVALLAAKLSDVTGKFAQKLTDVAGQWELESLKHKISSSLSLDADTKDDQVLTEASCNNVSEMICQSYHRSLEEVSRLLEIKQRVTTGLFQTGSGTMEPIALKPVEIDDKQLLTDSSPIDDQPI